MPYAVISDVASRLGRPITDALEVAQIEAWLGDVERIIRARVPDLTDLVTAGAPDADTVAMVEATAVIRKIKNPDGKVSEGIDDYNYRFGETTRKGDLFLTDEEWEIMFPKVTSNAFSTSPGFEPDFRTGWQGHYWREWM